MFKILNLKFYKTLKTKIIVSTGDFMKCLYTCLDAKIISKDIQNTFNIIFYKAELKTKFSFNFISIKFKKYSKLFGENPGTIETL